ncbi:MAG: hypothetical protein JO217_02745, partial [Acidobacteriaceae bacterium]|nr:hypothetical protein [Acidobacteriaceae bacterium]
ELVKKFESWRDKARAEITKASDADLGKIWKMDWSGQTIIEMPRHAVIRSMVMNHMIHHRGQLTVYLRLLGARVPGVYGPSADEMPAQ